MLAACFVAAIISRLPALEAPIALDDYAQRGLIEGRQTAARKPWNLYDFIDHTNHATLVDRGNIPWWSDTSESVARFLRPIPSLLVWLDYRVSGYGGRFPHVHSLLWWGLATWVAFALFRARFGQRIALIAAAVFALSAAHTVPIVWPANRSVLVTLVAGGLALVSHLRTRENSLGYARTAALWGLTFLTGEYALAFTGYVIAIECVRRGDSLRQRVRGVAPFLAPLVAYVLLRAALGYDIRQSTFYRNPIEDPFEYLENAPRAFVVLLGSVWLGIDDLYSRALPAHVLALAGGGIAAAAAATLWLTLRRLKPATRRDVAWLSTGSVLSLLPVLSATPSVRVVGVSALGASACIGLVLDSAIRSLPRWRKKRALGHVDVLFRFAVAAALIYLDFWKVAWDSHRFMRLAAAEEPQFARRLDWIREHMPPGKSTVVVLRGVTPPTAIVAPYMLREAAPARFRVLSQAYGRVVVVRVGSNALELLLEGEEPLIHFGTGDRIRAIPFNVSEVIDVPGMRATIVSLDADGLPKQLHFEFERDLDDPSYWWITEGAQGFREVPLPQITQGIRLLP